MKNENRYLLVLFFNVNFSSIENFYEKKRSYGGISEAIEYANLNTVSIHEIKNVLSFWDNLPDHPDIKNEKGKINHQKIENLGYKSWRNMWYALNNKKFTEQKIETLLQSQDEVHYWLGLKCSRKKPHKKHLEIIKKRWRHYLTMKNNHKNFSKTISSLVRNHVGLDQIMDGSFLKYHFKKKNCQQFVNISPNAISQKNIYDLPLCISKFKCEGKLPVKELKGCREFDRLPLKLCEIDFIKKYLTAKSMKKMKETHDKKENRKKEKCNQ